MSCVTTWRKEAELLQQSTGIAKPGVDGALRCILPDCDELINTSTNRCRQGHSQSTSTSLETSSRPAWPLEEGGKNAIIYVSEDGQVFVRSAFSRSFVDALKEAIPSHGRKWNPGNPRHPLISLARIALSGKPWQETLLEMKREWSTEKTWEVTAEHMDAIQDLALRHYDHVVLVDQKGQESVLLSGPSTTLQAAQESAAQRVEAARAFALGPFVEAGDTWRCAGHRSSSGNWRRQTWASLYSHQAGQFVSLHEWKDSPEGIVEKVKDKSTRGSRSWTADVTYCIKAPLGTVVRQGDNYYYLTPDGPQHIECGWQGAKEITEAQQLLQAVGEQPWGSWLPLEDRRHGYEREGRGGPRPDLARKWGLPSEEVQAIQTIKQQEDESDRRASEESTRWQPIPRSRTFGYTDYTINKLRRKDAVSLLEQLGISPEGGFPRGKQQVLDMLKDSIGELDANLKPSQHRYNLEVRTVPPEVISSLHTSLTNPESVLRLVTEAQKEFVRSAYSYYVETEAILPNPSVE